MAFQYGGIIDGIMLAEQHNEADEKKALDKEQYDKEWAFAREKFNFQVADAAESNMLKYLSAYKSQGGSGSGSGGVANNAELTNLLKTIKGELPEKSLVPAELVNANLKDVKKVWAIIQAGQKNAQEAGQIWSPELSESLFRNFYVTTVVNNNAFDPTAIAESAGIDLEGRSSFGPLWKDIVKQYIGPTTSTAVDFSVNTPVKPLDPAGQLQVKRLYASLLEGPLADMKADFNAMLAALPEGETLDEVDQKRLKEVDQALANLKLTTPSYRIANSIVGPQVAIELLTMNPKVQQYRTYFNKGLVFSEDAAGNELLIQAIRVGLLREGDKIMLGTRLVPITAASVAAAQEN